MTSENRPPTTKEAAQTWESLFRTQVTLMRRLVADDIWDELSMHEYDVLFTLVSKGSGSLPMRDLNENILMAQSSMSRLVDRLEDRGLVERKADPHDGRAITVVLTAKGAALQKKMGRRHVRSIAYYLGAALNAEELAQLRISLEKLRAAQSEIPTRASVPQGGDADGSGRSVMPSGRKTRKSAPRPAYPAPA